MKSKILFYDAYANNYSVGGSNKSCYLLLKNLSLTRKYDLYVVINDFNCNWIKKYEELGVVVLTNKITKKLDIRGRSKNLFFKVIIYSFWTLIANFWLFIKIKKVKVDVIVFNEQRAAATFLLSSKLARCHSVVFIRGTYQINCFLNKLIYKLCDRVVCISKGVHDILHKKYQKKSSTIYNVFEEKCTNDYVQTRSVEEFDITKKISLLTVASVVEYKGIDIALKAVKLLKDNHEFILEYNIVGNYKPDDTYYRKLLKEVRKLGLEGQVFFRGMQKDPYPFYLDADIKILPSRHEGLGRVILESLDAGLPVIASNIGGIPDIIENYENGLLFSVGDYSELYEKIILILQDKKMKQKFSRNGKKVLKKFAPELILLKFDDLLADIN